MNAERDDRKPVSVPDPSERLSAAEHKRDRNQREYGHSSGDRNPRTREDEWHEFKGGEQRDAGVGEKE